MNWESFTLADSVKDCEAIRQVLIGDKENPEDRKWTILGQSYGGFCAINYLSWYSEGLKEVFLSGGLAPLVDGPDIVYEALISESQLSIFGLWPMSLCRKGSKAEPYLLRKVPARHPTRKPVSE